MGTLSQGMRASTEECFWWKEIVCAFVAIIGALVTKMAALIVITVTLKTRIVAGFEFDGRDLAFSAARFGAILSVFCGESGDARGVFPGWRAGGARVESKVRDAGAGSPLKINMLPEVALA